LSSAIPAYEIFSPLISFESLNALSRAWTPTSALGTWPTTPILPTLSVFPSNPRTDGAACDAPDAASPIAVVATTHAATNRNPGRHLNISSPLGSCITVRDAMHLQ